MEIDVELTNRQYKQIIEHCEQYHLDTKKYFGEKLLDGFYFEIYGDLNEKNRIKEEIKKDILLNNKDKDKDYIKGQTQNPNYDTSSIKYRRRPIEVRTASAEDYEAAF